MKPSRQTGSQKNDIMLEVDVQSTSYKTDTLGIEAFFFVPRTLYTLFEQKVVTLSEQVFLEQWYSMDFEKKWLYCH